MATRPVEFHPEVLSDSERDELIALAQQAFTNFFQILHFASSHNFAPKIVRHSAPASATFSASSSPTVFSTRATVCATSKIHATLPEIADVFFSERTNAAIGFAQSRLVYALQSPTRAYPLRSCGLRWSLWRSPSALIRQRDLVYLEYMDTFVNAQGRRGWARCTVSIRHRTCPELTETHNLVRAHLYCSGTTYTESADEPGVIDAVTYYDCDTNGAPAWMARIVAQRKARNAQNLAHLIRIARIANNYNHKTVDSRDARSVDPHHIEYLRSEGVMLCRGCCIALPAKTNKKNKSSTWPMSKSRKCRECHQVLCKSCCAVVYCTTDQQKKLDRICVHCVDAFLAQHGRLGLYDDMHSSSSRGKHQGRRKLSRSQSLYRGSETSDESHTNRTVPSESPTAILEEKNTTMDPFVTATAKSTSPVEVDLSYLSIFKTQRGSAPIIIEGGGS